MVEGAIWQLFLLPFPNKEQENYNAYYSRYNRYRVTNIGAASSSDCSINLIQVGLFSDSLTRPIPEFDYIGSTTGYISVDFADSHVASV